MGLLYAGVCCIVDDLSSPSLESRDGDWTKYGRRFGDRGDEGRELVMSESDFVCIVLVVAGIWGFLLGMEDGKWSWTVESEVGGCRL